MIVFRRFRIHYNNIVSLLYGIVRSLTISSPSSEVFHITTKLYRVYRPVVEPTKRGDRAPVCCLQDIRGAARALEVAAPLVEWAENRLVSIPNGLQPVPNSGWFVCGFCTADHSLLLECEGLWIARCRISAFEQGRAWVPLET